MRNRFCVASIFTSSDLIRLRRHIEDFRRRSVTLFLEKEKQTNSVRPNIDCCSVFVSSVFSTKMKQPLLQSCYCHNSRRKSNERKKKTLKLFFLPCICVLSAVCLSTASRVRLIARNKRMFRLSDIADITIPSTSVL
jgi:hypothetical protein